MKCFYTKFECAVLFNNKETDWFTVNSWVRQGCIISLYSLYHHEEDNRLEKGNTWSIFTTLEDLDFIDDNALLSSRHRDMQEKTERLSHFARQLGLQLNANKTEEMRFNVTSSNKLKVDGKEIKQVDEFIFSGSVVSIEDSTQKDIKKDYQKQERPSRS